MGNRMELQGMFRHENHTLVYALGIYVASFWILR